MNFLQSKTFGFWFSFAVAQSWFIVCFWDRLSGRSPEWWVMGVWPAVAFMLGQQCGINSQRGE